MLKRCLAVSAISTIALQASAQSNFNELIVFGDSLLDSGNFVDGASGRDLRSTNRVDDYTNGEFAQVAPQIFASKLNIVLDSARNGGTNYAVGGYRSGEILTSITDGLPLSTGAVPSYFSNNQTIGRNSLVLIDGGGNDLRDILLLDQEDIPDAIETSASNMVQSIATLDARGAQYIMVANTPDLGLIPAVQQVRVDPEADEATIEQTITGASLATAGFNRAVQSFTTLKLNGVNIIPVDLSGLVNYLQDENTAKLYGFTTGMVDISGGAGVMFDSRYTCFDGSGGDCREHPIYGKQQDTADPSKLLFNDGLHPTAAVSEITADYLADIVLAPRTVGLLSELSLSASQAQIAVSGNELRQSRWKAAEGRLFVTGDITNFEYDTSFASKTESTGLTAGVTRAINDSFLIGVSVSAATQEIDLTAANFESDSYGVTGGIAYRQDKLFVDASLGLTISSFDNLKRYVKLGSQTLTAKGSTDGLTWGGDILTGYDLLSSPNYHLAPSIGVRFANSDIDAYVESGGGVSNYSWGDQRRKSLQWRYGFVAAAQVCKTVEVYAETFASQEEEDDLHDIDIRNTNLNAATYHLPSYQSNGDSFTSATVGASVDINGASLNFTWNYSDQGDGYENILLSYSIAM